MVSSKTVWTTILVIAIAIIWSEFFRKNRLKNPDAGLNVSQLITKFGYPLEIHEVETEDGYVLTLHRIPHGKGNEVLPSKDRVPVFFMHGILHSAAEFVNLGPGKALSFLLADKGYDVWLGNSRGTTWSRKHKKLDPDKDEKFWDFSFHEIGFYDLPANIDYILKVTGMAQLHYVGYSQGTSTFFVMASERPQYNQKIKLMTALAPAIFLGEPRSPLLRSVVYLRDTIKNCIEVLRWHELFPNVGVASSYLKNICHEDSLFVDFCLHHFFILHGYNEEQVNKTMLSTIFSNLPAGISYKQISHYIQIIATGKFQKYDFGTDQNAKKYGQDAAPPYDLSKINAPVALYYSTNDWTVQIKNIEKVIATLPNVVKKFLVPLEKFNHNDFVHARDAVSLLYNTVIEEISKY